MIEGQARTASPRGFAAAGAACAAVVGVLLAWLLLTPMPVLRTELRVLQFWWLEATVFVGLAVAGAVLGELARSIDRRDVIALSVLALAAIALTLTLPRRTNRIFYDEQIYQNVARNLADAKRAQLCNDGAIRDGRLHCAAAEYNKQPYAFPHLISLAYRGFGVRPSIPFALNAAAMGLTVALVYVLVVALFDDRIAAFAAALVLALIPEQLVWSASGAAEPWASLTCIAALLAAACFSRSRSSTALAGVAIAAAYAVQFRPESLLIVPVVGLLVLQRAPEEVVTPRMLWAVVIFLATSALLFGHDVAVRNEGWGTSQERMALAFAIQNLRVNGWFFVHDPRFPVAFTLLALVGCVVRGIPSGRLTMATYFLLFFVVTLFFYAGSYDYGADVRYSLMTNPPVAIFAGLGAAAVWRQVHARPLPAIAVVVLAIVAAAQYLVVSLPVVRATTDSAWAARADVDFAKSFAPKLPKDAYVLTHNPGMFQVWGVNAGQMSLATDARFLDELASRFGGGVYLHWNYWCNTDDPVHRALCTQVRGLRPMSLTYEFRSGDQRFAFYRMDVSQRSHSNP